MTNVSVRSSARPAQIWLFCQRSCLLDGRSLGSSWRRRFNTNSGPEVTGQTHHKGLQHPKQPTEPSDDGKFTLRSRKYGNRGLPLPPFLDPLRVAARSRRTAPKTERADIKDGDLSDFQKELALNPYAQALATDVRMDSLSQVRIPTHFLLRFGLAYNNTGSDGAITASKPDAKSTAAQLAFIPTRPPHKSVTSYTLANHSIIPTLSLRSGVMVNSSHRLRYSRMTGQPARKLKVQWNPQLPDEILTGLRNVVLDEIRACVDPEVSIPSPQQQNDSAVSSGANLFVKLPKSAALSSKSFACLMFMDEDVAGGSESPHEAPKYNLLHLLGTELAAEVLQTIGLSEVRAIGVVKHARVTPLLLALDRLRMYLP